MAESSHSSFFNERNILITVGTILIFLWLTFNETLGAIYLVMILLSYAAFMSDKDVEIRMEGDKSSWIYSIILALAGYALFILLSGVLVGVIFPNYVVSGENTFSMVARTMSTTTPILAGSLFLTIVGWGLLAALIETDFFFGKLNEWLSELFNVNIEFKLTSIRAWLLIIGLSFVFALFHIEVKGVTNNQALMLTFIFAVISLWMVFKNKETKAAILFHIISNTIAVLNTAGVIR